jgi:multicomponent Na+:H+ antiporter subunit D
MKFLLVLPIIVPMITAALGLAVWRHRHLQRALAASSAALQLAVALALLWTIDTGGILAVQIGNWPAPFGITLAADLLSAIMVVMGAFMGLAVVLFSLSSMDPERESFGYYPLLQVLLMGVSGAFLTGDLFNLYVWFEVMLMASFVLLALGGERAQLEGSIKYVTLNLISSAFFLAAVGILYGVTGTMNMADLSVRLRDHAQPELVIAISMLFLAAFGIKASLFPLFFWLPASYHTPPAAISAIFSGLLTKVGVYALLRVFTLLFRQDPAFVDALFLVLAGFTMLTGVLGAAAQNEFRRILSFHIVSQIGYIIMGLGLHNRLALAGAIFFLVHNILAKSNLFLISGVVHRLRGTYVLKDLGGLYKTHPVLAVCFMLSAMSLAGVPPLSGFFGKLTLIMAGLDQKAYLTVAVALLVSILTLFSMTKIWAAVFWKPAPDTVGETLPPPDRRALFFLMAPVVVLSGLMIVLGVGAEYFLGLALRASDQLLNPAEYVRAVMGS